MSGLIAVISSETIAKERLDSLVLQLNCLTEDQLMQMNSEGRTSSDMDTEELRGTSNNGI